jgi:hypothetical protein
MACLVSGHQDTLMQYCTVCGLLIKTLTYVLLFDIETNFETVYYYDFKITSLRQRGHTVA